MSWIKPEQVGRNNVLDLRVAELLRGTKKAVAGVADDHLNAPQLREQALDNRADRRRVGHVELLGTERLGILLMQISYFAGVANGADDTVAPLEQLPGQLAPESTTDARDEPCALCHPVPSLQPRARAT